MNKINRKSGLILTPAVFGALHKALTLSLKENYKISSDTLVDYQLYGFNSYDENAPSIKQLILDKTGKWVNGKYLYNKYQECKKGASSIKLTREFAFIYFQALGFREVNDFMLNSSLSEAAIAEQVNLEKPTVTLVEDQYYVGYYIGEEGNAICTRLTLSESNLKATWNLAYWEKEDEYSEYTYEGTIQYQQNGMSLYFKNEDTLLDRTMCVSIFCERQIKVKPFLIGGYTGYDRSRQPVVGEIVFQRVGSEKEQREVITNKKIDPIIAQSITRKRLVVTAKTPQSLLNLSPESKFASTIEDFIGNFKGLFIAIESGIFIIELSIFDNLGNASLSIAGHPLYNGTFKVQASGQLLIGRFINTATQAPIFMSIQVLPVKTHLFTGDLLGVSRFDQSFSGKIYLSSQKERNKQLPKYRGAELTLDEINSLPVDILTNLKDAFENNKLEKLFQPENLSTNNNYVLHLSGSYEVTYINEHDQDQKAQLNIDEKGHSTFTARHLTYVGNAVICEGSVLSIYFTHCNNIPHCGQIMGQVGRKSRTQITQFEASWLSLDEDFKTQTSKVIIRPI